MTEGVIDIQPVGRLRPGAVTYIQFPGQHGLIPHTLYVNSEFGLTDAVLRIDTASGERSTYVLEPITSTMMRVRGVNYVPRALNDDDTCTIRIVNTSDRSASFCGSLFGATVEVISASADINPSSNYTFTIERDESYRVSRIDIPLHTQKWIRIIDLKVGDFIVIDVPKTLKKSWFRRCVDRWRNIPDPLPGHPGDMLESRPSSPCYLSGWILTPNTPIHLTVRNVSNNRKHISFNLELE